MARRQWWFAAGIALLLAAALAVAAWAWLRPRPMQLATVTRGSVAAQVTGPGTVQARVPVTISARLTSTVTQIAVDVGDLVVPGQLLVNLESADLAARQAGVLRQQESVARQVDAAVAAVAKAQADLQLARAREARDAELQRQGFLSPASLDTSFAGARAAEAALQSAQASLAARRADRAAVGEEAVAARAQLAYTRLSAPMPGIVVQRLVEPGATVGPGTPILLLVDPRTLWVATRVDEALVERVQVGQAATIRLRSGSVLAGRVERIALQSDAATRELDVHVGFAAAPPRVAIEQEAQVRIETGREEGLVVPAGALVQGAGGEVGVLQVLQGRARFVAVRPGPESGGLVLVRQGLAEGDQVLAVAGAAKPGMRVRAAP